MRAVVILVAVVASIASTCEANAQSSNSQPAAPQISPQTSQSSDPPRGIPSAPVGHRQPRAGDVPKEGTITRSETDVELERKLNICRGC
jgi:hypothetical protein